jgi:hypothetical protein
MLADVLVAVRVAYPSYSSLLSKDACRLEIRENDEIIIFDTSNFKLT